MGAILIYGFFCDLPKKGSVFACVFLQAGKVVVGVALRVGDGDVNFFGDGLAAADVVVGGETGVIGVVGQFRE